MAQTLFIKNEEFRAAKEGQLQLLRKELYTCEER
jgi:hypothetical protein